MIIDYVHYFLWSYKNLFSNCCFICIHQLEFFHKVENCFTKYLVTPKNSFLKERKDKYLPFLFTCFLNSELDPQHPPRMTDEVGFFNMNHHVFQPIAIIADFAAQIVPSWASWTLFTWTPGSFSHSPSPLRQWLGFLR